MALKTFKAGYLPDREARDRFLREGSAWVDLGTHAHIVRCYKVEYIDPTAFLALELIAKEAGRDDASLRAWLGQPLPVDQALLYAIQMARGMCYAVEKIPGFVHRDLKPENMLVGIDRLTSAAVLSRYPYDTTPFQSTINSYKTMIRGAYHGCLSTWINDC